VVIPPEPDLLATLDGFKVESLALVDGPEGMTRLYAGTDDEDFGGVLRPLPMVISPANARASEPPGITVRPGRTPGD
jgi:hypothetical protein